MEIQVARSMSEQSPQARRPLIQQHEQDGQMHVWVRGLLQRGTCPALGRCTDLLNGLICQGSL
jgi:hypothetical protein